MDDIRDRERFAALYDLHFPRVWAYVVARIGRQQAEEVVSDTFAVAWRRRSELPVEPLPWLLVVARNVLRDSRRGAARRVALAEELRVLAGRQAFAADIAGSVVERAALYEALASLSDGDREVLVLVAWAGLASGAAARVLGCSRAAFFMRLHRARRRFARALELGGADPTATERQAPPVQHQTTKEATR
jgi:RNA polymerase sigma-70 factor, ECF subfamily